MKTFPENIERIEFEARIFVSFAIVAGICALSFTVFRHFPLSGALPGLFIGLSASQAVTLAYLLAALTMIPASLLRMWAGSFLTSYRMMRFEVQNDGLVTGGPYRLVRNPIYLSDLIAFAGFALVLPPIGLLMPLLLFFHYEQIIRYEEKALRRNHPQAFTRFCQQVPRLLPDRNIFSRFRKARHEWVINRDGLVHNALYVLFVPGFLWSACTHQLLHALALGLPAVVLWTVLHIRIGLGRSGSRAKIESVKQ
jgi:protein-S-isoprenylcysteine O-methyltransferase Ste14